MDLYVRLSSDSEEVTRSRSWWPDEEWLVWREAGDEHELPAIDGLTWDDVVRVRNDSNPSTAKRVEKTEEITR